MKKLTCEMCGSTDLVKDGGVFVCQTCGCKYSVEEAKKMMIEGTVNVAGTVQVDDTGKIQNYLELSQNAYESGNGETAFNYANKALEIDPQNYQAWIAKMKAIQFLSTFGKLRLVEVIEAGNNAILYSPDNKTEEVEEEVYLYELRRALSLLKVATTRLSDTAEVRDLFKRFSRISPFSAAENTRKADSNKTLLFDNVATEAVAMVKAIPDEALVRHKSLVRLTEECAKQYQYVTDALVSRYEVYYVKLLESAQNIRRKHKQDLENKARNAEKKNREIEEKRKEERIKKYWEENVELKQQLDKEKESLNNRIRELNSLLIELPENTAVSDYENQITTIQKEFDSLGFFKMKEKKQLQEKIEYLKTQLENAKEVRDNAISPISEEISSLKKRVSQIEDELKKDR